MKVIICTDNKMGTMFNNRRQSRDRILCEKVVSLVGDGMLFISEYSRELFENFDISLVCGQSYLSKAEKGDFCFVEGESLLPYEEKIESIVLFKWNRDYPSDKKADIDLSNCWVLTQAEDFTGSSHEKITMEIYTRG